jgi:hypothetical protein
MALAACLVFKRRALCLLPNRGRLCIGLEVQLIVRNDGKVQPIGADAPAAKHAPRLASTQRCVAAGEQFAAVTGKVG